MTLPVVGFIGLGAMGGPMVRSLLRAGYPVVAFDRDPERLAAGVADGATAAEGAADVVARGEVICTSLPSSEAFVTVAEETLLPGARAGQVFIEFGTTTPPEARRLAALFAKRGAALFEAPVSGGPGGAQSANLKTFAGGDPAVFEQVRPLLEAVGGKEGLVYCGPSGAGQAVKGVNQLAMGLGAAAYLEAVAFGVLSSGVDPEVIGQAVGGPEGWRAMVTRTARAAASGKAEEIGVKFRELPYFLREAEARGFSLPLTEVLYTFCDAGERVVIDDRRRAPSFWHELTKDRGKE